MIASVLMGIGIAIGLLVKALLLGGTADTAGPPPEDKKGVKEWLRKKLKALASLPGRLVVKLAETLPGIIETIISWILNRVKEVVGWVFQNLQAFVAGVGWLLYTCMVTKK